MSQLELATTSDGMYQVCLEEDGFRECCVVSSMHLVQDKEPQLRRAIRRRAFNALIENKAGT